MSSASSPSSSPATSFDALSWCRTTRNLVSLERTAELDEERVWRGAQSNKVLEAAGVLLTKLVVTDVTTGLYGRCLLTLGSARGGPLRQSELSARDIVEICEQGGGGTSSKGKAITTGVVYRLKESSITLVLDEYFEPSSLAGQQLCVLKLANEVTYQRYEAALDTLEKEFTQSSSAKAVSTRLLRVLYGDVEPVSATKPLPWFPFSTTLNEPQKQAVQMCLDANDVAMIHGPPGTGKTTTVVELIRQFVARGMRVLACAPSNLAVDNLVEKLSEKLAGGKNRAAEIAAAHSLQASTTAQQAAMRAAAMGAPASSGAAYDAASSSVPSFASLSNLGGNKGAELKLTRLGHPARIIPSVLKYTLDSVVQSSDAESVCAAIRSDLTKLTKSLDKSKDRNEKYAMRKDLRELQKALRETERKAIKESLKKTEVICCTLTNCASKLMEQFSGVENGFDVVIIDEAAQALEIACLLAVVKGRKLILAGDNQQLGPTVKSKQAVAGGFETTLYDRLYSRPYGSRITTMLTEQYRMNQLIMQWSSQEMYHNRLTGPESITKHLLCDMPGVTKTDDTTSAFVVIDTAGLNLYEDDIASGSSSNSAVGALAQQQRSKSNASECAIIKVHMEALIKAGISPKDIGIITPYNGQVSLLREMLLDEYGEYGANGLRIGTVDGFQGQECEAVLITMVRSNSEREVGFLREDRRINVAITRARRHVCIVLDSETVSSHPFLERLVEYASEHADYRMATDPNQVHQDLSSGGLASSVEAVASTKPSAANDGAEKKEDGSAPAPIVSPPKPKKERTKPAATTPSTVGASSAATPGVVKPVEEEWPEVRIEALCEDVLKRGRKALAAGSSASGPLPSYSFPPTLNSYERQLVHAVAERVANEELSHESQGDGLKRFIMLKYKAKPVSSTTITPSANTVASSKNEDADDDDEEPSSNAKSGQSKKAAKKAAKKATLLAAAQAAQQTSEDRNAARRRALDAMELKSTGKISASSPAPASASTGQPASPATVVADIPGATSFATLLDDMNDAAAAEEDAEDEEADNAAAAASSKPKKNNNKKKKKKAKGEAAEAEGVPNDDEEDLDSLLSEFQSDVCKFSGCTARVKVMGFLCQYCKERHCVKHMNPVLHGCGAAHKQSQLAQMSATLKQSTQTFAHKPLKESEKTLLKSKLDKKIAEDKKNRTKQTKADEKKK